MFLHLNGQPPRNLHRLPQTGIANAMPNCGLVPAKAEATGLAGSVEQFHRFGPKYELRSPRPKNNDKQFRWAVYQW